LELRAATLDVLELPAEFHSLEPHEVEDVLCIFKDKFAASGRTPVHPVAAWRIWSG
jgi:hypothetical protein